MIRALTLVLLTAIPAHAQAVPHPTGMQVRRGYLFEMFVAAQRTIQTELEEFYCYAGEIDRGGGYRVSKAIKPRQRAVALRFVFWREARVYHDDCPPGTLADFHTHPWPAREAPYMSCVDRRAAALTPYHVHLIAYQDRGGRIHVVAWTRRPDGDYDAHEYAPGQQQEGVDGRRSIVDFGRGYAAPKCVE